MADRREPPRFDALLPPEMFVGAVYWVVYLRPRAAVRCS